MQAMEERLLFLLLLLRQPRLRMVYVTRCRSTQHRRVLPVAAARRHPEPRARAPALVVGDDGSPRPLTEKLLARPRLLAHIAALIPDRDALAPHPLQHDGARA